MIKKSDLSEQLKTKGLTERKQFFATEKWNPEKSGEIAIYIDNEGEWFYQGTPFKRDKMIQLFSHLLRKEGMQYYLVTPVEKLKIRVEDVPFVITGVTFTTEKDTQYITFTTNTGDSVRLDNTHPLYFSSAHGLAHTTNSLLPYIRIRYSLEARINRNVYYELTNKVVDHQGAWGVWSDNKFWSMK